MLWPVFQPHSLVALVMVLALAGCEANTAPAPKSTRPVQVERVAFESAGMAQEFAGVVRARHETDLAFRVAGKIVARDVNVGDRVEAGDVIARLDPQDLRLQVESAEAELAAATSVLAEATAELDRYTTLKARGFTSLADFDRKTAAKDEAEARLERARHALDLARNQLSYTELKADADGVITATLAEPGQVVSIGQSVARLAHRGDKEAVVALPETWHGHAREAQATVRLWANGEHSYAAQLRELSPQADPATRTYLARFTIRDADDAVALGMTATVTLSRASETPIARLPLSAVLNHGSGPAVYVVEPSGTLALRPVAVASFTESDALVTSGIRDGDRIVSLGVHRLEAGSHVRTVELR